MVPPNDIEPFAIRFSGEARETAKVVSAETIAKVMESLEYFARECARRLARGGSPSRDELDPIATRFAMAECTFDDFTRTITVTALDPIPGSPQAGAEAAA